MKAASKLISLTSLGLAMLLGGGCANRKENTKMDTIYQFTAKGRNGTSLDLALLKGKVLLIVNTATGCGFTPQYTGLEKLYAKYHDKGLEILDFPCDQFGHQAPGSDDEIHQFCALKYNTSFDQLAKIEVNGPNADPIYKFLKAARAKDDAPEAEIAKLRELLAKHNLAGAQEPGDIEWNFTKCLVDREGKLIARFEPTADMKDVKAAIEELL
jgi:glutathione peroxidase